MPRVVSRHSQCLRCLADRATMRFCFSSSPSFALRQYATFSSKSSHRTILGTRYHSDDLVIFKNNLRRTLEAHRSSNRTSLVRKVFDRTSLKDFARPPTSKEEVSVLRSPEKLSSSGAEAQPVSSVLSTWTERNPRNLRKGLEKNPRDIPGDRIRWGISTKIGRWAQSPWMHRWDADRQWSDGFSQLDAEIRALEEYLLPTPLEQDKVNHIVSEVSSMLRDIIPLAPQVIGSRRSGFAMSHSGLDFILPVPDPARSSDKVRRPSPSRPHVLDLYSSLLSYVKRTLEQCSSFNGRVELTGKRNSILTAVHHETGVRLQFYCGETLPSSSEYTRDYHAEYPAIRPLYMVVRLILDAQELFGSHQSSVGPDTIVMLLVVFLKMNHGRFQNPRSLGEQLLAFLKVYGSEVDLTSTGVSVDPPSFFDADTVKATIKDYEPNALPAYLRGQRALINLKRTAVAKHNIRAASTLCLQDPANYMNNLGRTCSRTHELQNAFICAYDRLSARLGTWERPKCNGLTLNSLLSSALQANFNDFSRVRARIVSAGRRCP
ncbi:hypothetical protein BDV28DRAFT_144218 [Aspergillus coremiiformis]|uniref:Polynucleotide adenylyltransferase n=1 Tax=Aspergillus coremiiformis TaxID=138285 RepID=A0A5N6YRM4_9EURO|nr:hypothetical protein BDV28DRAFT_144218 [Aspergillus coremiiformis]